MRQMFEAAEQGQDFTLDPRNASKRRRVRDYSAVAVDRPVEDDAEFVVIQRALQAVQRRPPSRSQERRNDKHFDDGTVKNLKSRPRQIPDHGYEQHLPLELMWSAHQTAQTSGPMADQQAGRKDVDPRSDHRPWGPERRAHGDSVEAIRAASTIAMKPPSRGVYARPRPYAVEAELDDKPAPMVEYVPAPAQPPVRPMFEQTSAQAFDDGPDTLIMDMFDQALIKSLPPLENKSSHPTDDSSEGRDKHDQLADASIAADTGLTQLSASAAASLANDSIAGAGTLTTWTPQQETMEARSTQVPGMASLEFGVEPTHAAKGPGDAEDVRLPHAAEPAITSNRQPTTAAGTGIGMEQEYSTEHLRTMDDFVDWPTQAQFQDREERSIATSVEHFEIPPVQSQEFTLHYFGLCHARVQSQLDARQTSDHPAIHLSNVLPESRKEQLSALEQRVDKLAPDQPAIPKCVLIDKAIKYKNDCLEGNDFDIDDYAAFKKIRQARKGEFSRDRLDLEQDGTPVTEEEIHRRELSTLNKFRETHFDKFNRSARKELVGYRPSKWSAFDPDFNTIDLFSSTDIDPEAFNHNDEGIPSKSSDTTRFPSQDIVDTDTRNIDSAPMKNVAAADGANGQSNRTGSVEPSDPAEWIGSCPRDMKLLGHHLTTYCENHSERAHQLAEAERSIQAIATPGTMVHECVYEPVVHSLCSMGHAHEAETFVTRMVNEHGVIPGYWVRYHLAAGLASTGDWHAVNEYMIKWHNSPQARKRPFAFAMMFTAIFEHYIAQKSMNESYDYLMYALEHWGLLPTEQTTAVFLPVCVRSGRFDLIESWIQLSRELHPKMDAGTMSLDVTCRLADVWYQQQSTCEEIERACFAISRSAVHDPFSAPLREAAMTATKEDLKRLLEKDKVVVKLQNTSAVNMDLDSFDGVVRSATALLQNHRHQHMSFKQQRLFDNLGRQVDAVARLGDIFCGAPAEIAYNSMTVSARERAGVRKHPLHDTDTGMDEHQIPHRIELWPIVARGYAQQHLVHGEPISHRLLESIVPRLRLQQRQDEAIQLLESVHESPYVQGITGTCFGADILNAWLRIAIETRSPLSMETALFAALSSTRNLEKDTRFNLLAKLVILRMKQRALRAPVELKQTQNNVYLTANYLEGRLAERLWKREGASTANEKETYPEYMPWWERFKSPIEGYDERFTKHTTSPMVAVA